MKVKRISLVLDGNLVLFVDSDKGEPIYSFRKDELPLTRDGDYSEWILHLLTKTWISINTLYELAVVINREFPNNSIDWKKTFLIVERKNYFDFTGNLLLPEEESISKSVVNKILFNRQESTPEIDIEIEEIVRNNLRDYGLN